MNDLFIYLYTLLTVMVFTAAIKLAKRLKSAILNPFLLSLAMLIPILVLIKIPFRTYYQGNFPLNELLGVSVVALAIPFYEQLPQLLKHWRKILIIVLSSTFLTMITGVAFALCVEADPEIIAAILPKSVTTAIAISISEEIGGSSAISAVAVLIAGITGSSIGLVILRWVQVINTHSIGLSMGAVSHALGTARSMEYSVKAGSYASVAMVLCGVFSSIFAPLVFEIVLKLIM